jgi:hypothetical protein
MRTTFEREGDVRGTDLLAALVALWREGASGTLQFSRSGATAGFEIAAGEVIATQSSDPRFETASILLRAGKLDEATLGRLAVPEGGDRALVALQAGVLTRREWRWGEKIRAVELLSDLLAWLEGEYWLLRTPARTPGEFRLPVPRLILELFLRSRDRSLVLHHLGGVDHPLTRAPHFDQEFPTFGLTADAESVVRLIDGRSTAAEIASEAPAEAFAVEKLLAALVTIGLVRPEFASEGSPPIRSVLEAGEEPAERTEEEEETQEEEQEQEEEGAGEVRDERAAETEERGTADESGFETPGTEAEENEGTDEAEETRESAEIEEVVLDEPAAASSFAENRGTAPPGEPPRERPLPEEPAVEDAALDAEVQEDELERARMRFEPESSMAGAASEDLGAEDRGDLDMSLASGPTLEPGSGPVRRGGRAAPLLVLLLLLAAGVAAVLLLRRGGGPPAGASSTGVAAAPSPTAEQEPVAGVPATPIEASPYAAPSPAAGTGPAGRPEATRTATAAPARPLVPAPRPTAAPPRRARGESTREYWADRAARDRKRSAADRQARFSIQLELACEIGSLVEAWKHDRPAGTMWVLTTPYQGRTCFRVLWGRYPGREAARRALASAPSFFSTPRNHPMVVPIR